MPLQSNIHFTRVGTGPAVVFLHGAYINADFWEHQITDFAKQYEVINIDLPSHGQSPPVDIEEYSVTWYSDAVLGLLDELGIKKFSVVGLSLGAMIAQCLGAKVPERVQAIVLVGGSVSMQHTWLEKLVLTVLFPKPIAMWLFGQLSTKQFLKLSFMLTWFMRGNQWLGEPYTRQKIRTSIAAISRPEIKKIYAAVHTFRKQNIEKGHFPVLAINGQYDSPLIHFHARSQQKRLGSRCTFLKVPNTGHGCNYDRPELFNQMVMDWLKLKGITKQQIGTADPNGTSYTSEYSKSHENHPAN